MKLSRHHIIEQERVSAREFTCMAQAARDVGDVGREAEMSIAAEIATQQADKLERTAV